MMLDYTTLLMAIGLSGLCLAVTLFATWMTARVERFLLSWAIGIGLTVPSVVVYKSYVETFEPLAGIACFLFQYASFAFVYGAAYRFRTGRPGRRRIVAVFVACNLLTIPPMLAGYSGVAFILFNALLGGCLVITAQEYWKGREEARLPLTVIFILYTLTALSFFLCGLVLIAEKSWVLTHAPNHWTEDLNLVMAIIGITGIGAMSMALNQWRAAARNRCAAMTDALTGLLNRRALVERYGERPLGPHAAVIAFDLDRFKRINDRHGHAAGDAVLCAFAQVLTENMPVTAIAARLGGEEFALVLDRAAPDRVVHAAESIRAAFAGLDIVAAGQGLSCTVSAGIAFASGGHAGFDALLAAADEALYASKQAGRNRVSTVREVRRTA